MENYNIHFNEFATSGDVQAALDAGTLVKPYVALVNGEVDINGMSETDYRYIPLTFEIVSAGTLVFGTNYTTSYELSRTIYVKINDGEWTETGVGPTTFGQQVTYNLNAGDKLQMRASYPKWGYDDTQRSFRIYGTCYYNLYGNIMSLVDKDSFAEITSLDSSVTYAFSHLFEHNSGAQNNVIDASNLCLPATGLSYGCYFAMFNGCTLLTNVPVLPATTLAESCYENMFYGCTNLNYVKCLATDISASNSTNGWLNDVSPTGTFVKNPNMSSWTTGYEGIPAGWTVVNA